MKRPRLRALVLTAGFGVRLRPLTFFIPKPVLPIDGEPVVGYTLRSLQRVGCEAAVLNLHHLSEAIPVCLGRRYYGLPLVYSHEEVIQGTLGALYRNRKFLSLADAVLLVNGDTLCRWPWRSMIRRHLRSGAEVTLLLQKRADQEAFGGGVGVGKKGSVVQFRDQDPVAKVIRKEVFAGAHVLSPRVLEKIHDSGPADIISELYQPLLKAGGYIGSVMTSRKWHDLGTGERYLEAALDWVGDRWNLFGRKLNKISPLADVHDGASLEHSIVEPWSVIEKDVRIERSIVLPGARIASGSEIRSSIIGPGVSLAAASIERRMINQIKSGQKLGVNDTAMGGVVYTPLSTS